MHVRDLQIAQTVVSKAFFPVGTELKSAFGAFVLGDGLDN